MSNRYILTNDESTRLKAVLAVLSPASKDEKPAHRPRGIDLRPLIVLGEQVIIMGGWEEVARLVKLGMIKEKEMKK